MKVIQSSFSNIFIKDLTTIVDWGLTLPQGTQGTPCSDGDICMDYGVAKVVVTNRNNCQRVAWSSSDLSELKDCVHMDGHW